ncbi:ArnT family glycosyltransferase [Marivita sp. S2033]|uniref:ArnT family glycosyltransferase n=1 Tax=Marivita sp. S2033 TaxID=3373187 RepID=UPI003982011F
MVLFATAFLLRAWGADFGLFNGDERVNDSARFLAGHLVPTQHFYPPFFNYLNGAAFIGLFLFGLSVDMWSTTAEFRQAYFSDPTPFYLTARYVTAAIGALAAPLFFSASRRLGLGTGLAVISASFAAIFPIAVFMAHIAKGDTGLAVFCLAVVWTFFMRLESNHPTRWNIIIGLSVALALGFKQSALLFLGPLALAMIVVLAGREGNVSALKSFGIALLFVVIAWPIMNIGILLDIDGFWAFQRIQAVMSVRDQDGFGAGLPITMQIFGDAVIGLNPAILAIALIVPVWAASGACRLRLRDAIIGVWIANAVSTIVISLLVGTRQPEQLFLPNLYVFLLLAVVVLMDMLRVYVRWPRAVVALVSLVGFAIMLAGAKNVIGQARATPIAQDLATYLLEHHSDARIQTGVVLPVPQTVAAQRMELDRLERLGRKYNIDMPDIAPERIIVDDAQNALFWVHAPFVMSGLEGDGAIDQDFPIEPHAWPVQPEEWNLQRWRDAGFDVFAVNHFDFLVAISRSSYIRTFHTDLQEHCKTVQSYDARKPLFLEFDVRVFECP